MQTTARADQRTLLVNLPIELLENILSFIAEPCILAKLSLCSYRLRQVVEPFLWSSFTQTGDSSRNADDLRPFLLSILRRPELGNLVRCLNISRLQSSIGIKVVKKDARICYQDDFELLAPIVYRIKPLDPDEWITAIDYDISELYFVLLLTKSSKLEKLSFQTANHTMPLMYELAEIVMNRSGHAMFAFLKELKILEVEYAEDQFEETFELWEYKSFLSLPTLKEFRGVQVCEENDVRPDSRNLVRFILISVDLLTKVG
jgi:hypothetical protein